MASKGLQKVNTHSKNKSDAATNTRKEVTFSKVHEKVSTRNINKSTSAKTLPNVKSTVSKSNTSIKNKSASGTILLTPKNDWERVQRRHQNAKPVKLSPTSKARSCALSCVADRDERRHYQGSFMKSHLDDYF